MRVMIVDDEMAARQVLRERCAGEQDIEVVGEYADAECALAALPQQAPDLIFLDVRMGKLSGMQLAQALGPRIAPDRPRGVITRGCARPRSRRSGAWCWSTAARSGSTSTACAIRVSIASPRRTAESVVW